MCLNFLYSWTIPKKIVANIQHTLSFLNILQQIKVCGTLCLIIVAPLKYKGQESCTHTSRDPQQWKLYSHF